jgi:uncharacterized BrkB/YihY/UPF0761 family membrane protein
MLSGGTRRVRFAIVVLVSQLLLIAMAVAWVIHGVLIAQNGQISFIETNPWILYGEIIATVLITLFAVSVFIVQYRRLKEKRRGDDTRPLCMNAKTERKQRIRPL